MPANLEYILFGVGIFVILLSLYLSYRLEKGKKDSSEVSGEVLKKELVKLREEMKERNLPRKIEDLYQLIEHKVRTQNSKNDDLKRQIKLIKNTVEDSEKQRINLGEKLDSVLAEVEEIKEDYTGLKEELKEGFSKQREEIEFLKEELNLLLENDDTLQAEISEIKKEIIVEEEEGESVADIRKQKPDLKKEVEGGFAEEDDKKQELADVNIAEEEEKEIQEETQIQQPGNGKFSGELAEEKRKKFEKIRELKEAGMEVSEIADKVNMGIREVELFWKVNAPRG